MTLHIFTYGSLMFSPVWRRVVSGNYASAPAIAHGYARYAVIGQSYPGMVPAQGEQVRGLLYFDVGVRDIALLDAFEGGEYRRSAIVVERDNGDPVSAHTYIYIDKTGLTNAEWHPERFEPEQFAGAFCTPDTPG